MSDENGDDDKDRPIGWMAAISQMPFIHQRHKQGNPLALLDGLLICSKAEFPLPEWLNKAIAEFICDALIAKPKGKRGRSNAPLPRQREKIKQHVRHHFVWHIRQFQAEKNPLFKLILLPNRRARQMYADGELTNLGTTVKEACRLAHVLLRGTFAQATPEVMEKAFLRGPVEGIVGGFYSTEAMLGLRDFDEGEPVVLAEHWRAANRMPDAFWRDAGFRFSDDD